MIAAVYVSSGESLLSSDGSVSSLYASHTSDRVSHDAMGASLGFGGISLVVPAEELVASVLLTVLWLPPSPLSSKEHRTARYMQTHHHTERESMEKYRNYL